MNARQRRNENFRSTLIIIMLAAILAGLVYLCVILFTGGPGGQNQQGGAGASPAAAGVNADIVLNYSAGESHGEGIFNETKINSFGRDGAIHVEYPYTGQMQIDSVIAGKTEDIYARFVDISGADAEKCRLTTRYEAKKASERFGGIAFSSEFTNDNTGVTLKWVDTLAIDFATGESFTLSQWLNEGSRTALAEVCAAALSGDSYRGIISPDKLVFSEQNYSRFMPASDGLHLFMDSGDAASGIVDLKISYDYIKGGMVVPLDGDGALPAASPAAADASATALPASPSPSAEPVPTHEPSTAPSPSPSPSETVQNTPSEGQKMVAFSFDDGPDNTYTNRILDIVEQYNIKATFFMVGSMFETRENTVRRVDSLGCEIGNHTMNHNILNRMESKAEFDKEVEDMNDALENLTGKRAKLLRPPGGGANDKVKGWSGYPLILWSVDTEDWSSKDPDMIYDAVMREENLDGKIILMHDIYDSTVKAVERIVPDLLAKGYKIVTVSELIESGGGKMQPGSVYGRRIKPE